MSGPYQAPGDEFAQQWTQPTDIFSVLLILGGDVIQLACASMAGGTSIPPNPVTFSFGWVAYAVSALLSAIGENRLITCQPEAPLLVFNLKSGYHRSNNSWLLGRLVKTYEHWMPDAVRDRWRPQKTKKKRTGAGSSDEEETGKAADSELTGAGYLCGLCIAVYEWQPDLKPGVPPRDLAWWSGYFVSFIQLAVSVIPLGLHGDWAILLTTAAGTLLSYTSASLPQWRVEKWRARNTEHPKPVALTAGNGSPTVIIIEGARNVLDLEDLAAGGTADMPSTRYLTFVLSLLWIVLLITCTGIQSHTWYLLAVGGIGMLHNIIIAAVPRRPEALGIPIRLKDSETRAIFAEFKVMWSLMELEMQYEGWGEALRKEFFPGDLTEDEKKWWNCEEGAQRTQERLDGLCKMKEEYREKRKRKKEEKLREAKKKAEGRRGGGEETIRGEEEGGKVEEKEIVLTRPAIL